MRLKEAIVSCLHLLILFFFFAFACFWFALPHMPEWQMQGLHFLSEGCRGSGYMALGCLGCALLLWIGFYGFGPHKWLRLQMGSHLTSVEIPVVQQTVAAFFREHFPEQVNLQKITFLKGNRVEMAIACFAKTPQEQKALLKQMEQGLQVLFKERFGYTKPFYLVVYRE